MKDAERILLAIPGVTEAQVFAKLLVRCEFPMSPETMKELQLAQAQIEYETGWKVEMTISGRATKEAQAKLDQRLLDITRRHLFGEEGKRPKRKLSVRPGGMGPTYERLMKEEGG